MKNALRHIDTEIDKITNSIENAITGEVFDTEIVQISEREIKKLIKTDWLFDWQREIKDSSKKIYKLTTVNNPSIIQGLLSIENKTDHVFMHLVESSKFNKGKSKIYLGVPANLVAFACKISFEYGYEGFVAFDSKSALIDHYINTIGATHFRGVRMFIDSVNAGKLVSQYFKY